MTAHLTLAAVPGITVGHATVPAHGTGCTVVLGPAAGLRAAVAVRGRATGTREIDALSPRHIVERVDAILLTGGSAYGLGAADGVMRWLRERGRGLPVGPAGTVPIVPTAVLFDLGNTGKPVGWPSPDDAYRACEAAGSDVAEGSVGAGTGATVGKAAGLDKMMKAGLGTSGARAGAVVVGALVVVNAVGDVRDGRGEIIAGARGEGGRFLDSLRFLAEGGAPFGDPGRLVRNTTLAVIATNAALDRVQLEALAQTGSDALARRITPYGTLYDGDVVFAVSTAAVPAASPLQAEALAALAVPEAVERAVR
ncbi:MAG TPA: P1 family peptidase [Gemmatimonadales bacterium]|jgi:L-aminopeptidase/D-esterase-like protein|nr:P1 family peptidase [Gemmatimonadales bacterium]